MKRDQHGYILSSVLQKLGYLTCTLCMLISFDSGAQDIHFSQFNNSPLSLNPAETGNFKGDW
ncbi:MAG: hypothetical protein MRY83_23295, partial [Flavobacteriales bacterium]|nr:hypothetical protein [Flavobacteriales bacterium]